MKKIIAILLVAVLFVLPVMAAFEEEANIGNVKFTIGKAESAPVLGQFDTSKYTKIEPGAGDMSYAWDDSLDNGLDIAKGQSVETYLAYDANNVYGLVFTDTKHYENTSEDADGNAWQMSCIQISAAAANAEGTERLEYGIWRKSDDGALGAVIWADSANTDASAEFAPVAGSNYTVALQGDKLAYEFVLPMNTFLAKPAVEGEVIAFSLVMAQRAEDVYVHTQIASGCTGNGKTAENFMRLTLGAAIAPPVVDEPAADEPVADTGSAAVVAPITTTTAPAAKTGDAGIITLAVVMMIAAAGIVIFRKKSAAK